MDKTSTKPRLIIFSTSYKPFIGGAEIAIAEVAKRLRDQYEIFVVTARMRRALPRREAVLEGTIVRVGMGLRFDAMFLPILGCFSGLRLARGAERAILWGMDISQGSVAALFTKTFMRRIPFALVVQYGYGEGRIEKGRGGLIRFFFRSMLARADYYVGESSFLEDLARRYGYGGPSIVIPNGIDENLFFPAESRRMLEKKGHVVITTGRLVSKNGVDVLIRAVALVRKKVPDVICRVVGDGPLRGTLQDFSRELHLHDVVQFTGSVPHASIPEYLREADVFVRPSRFEGMGNSFVEALACGIPIIGTPVEGILDVIQDGSTGLFARVDDPEDLAEKIITLLTDRELADHIRTQGLKSVREHFRWDDIARAYRAMFEQLMAHRALFIVIATPMLPPDIGGPARYAVELTAHFRMAGHRATAIAFTPYLRYPALMRHLWYAAKLLLVSRHADILFALDYTSVGWPASWIARIRCLPLVVRVEGDFLWERYVERERIDVTLPQFYPVRTPMISISDADTDRDSRGEGNDPVDRPRSPRSNGIYAWYPRRAARDRFWERVAARVFRRATLLVFSSDWRRSMVMDYFGIAREKTALIRNVWPDRRSRAHDRRDPVILWAGRMLFLKNLDRLVRAFARANSGKFTLELVGSGLEEERIRAVVAQEKIKGVRLIPPLDHEALLERMACAAFVVLPSFSDVGPNVVTEAISVGTPVLITKESGFAEYVAEKHLGMVCDPLNEEDLEKKMRHLMYEANLTSLRKHIMQGAWIRSWEEVTRDWLPLLYHARALSRHEL